jgi:hypothetical protein
LLDLPGSKINIKDYSNNNPERKDENRFDKIF